MATIKVSSSSALSAALKSAGNGDTISLASGHYNLSASGGSKAVTITSEGNAVIDSLNLSRVSNLTIDGVDFNGEDGLKNAFRVWGSDNITIRNGDMEGVANGYGLGRGLLIQADTNFTFENMTMHGFSTGVFIDGVDGLVMRNNHLVDLAWDGIIGGNIHNAVFTGNSISLDIPAGRKHSDGFQFWNVGSNKPSDHIRIEDNVIRADNTQSHGIYMANAIANGGGGANTYFSDVVIKGNTIISGDGLGLSWGQTDNLDIQDNIVLKDTSLPAGRGAPQIRVHYNATDVSITGNYTHQAPSGADANWQPHATNNGWTIANNKIVPVGTTLADVTGPTSPPPPPPPAPPPPTSPPPPPPPVQSGNGQADHFRFDAAGPTDVVNRLDFGEGDTIELYNYKGGTFHAQKGGNVLVVTIKGAIIDSMADLHELEAASDAVHIRQGSNDTLVMDIDQPAGVHSIEMTNMAHLYFA